MTGCCIGPRSCLTPRTLGSCAHSGLGPNQHPVIHLDQCVGPRRASPSVPPARQRALAAPAPSPFSAASAARSAPGTCRRCGRGEAARAGARRRRRGCRGAPRPAPAVEQSTAHTFRALWPSAQCWVGDRGASPINEAGRRACRARESDERT